jgi:hypothetical protein
MAKKYMLYVKDTDEENNMEIQCRDADDLALYASECIKQGYIEVIAKVEDFI